MKKWIIRIVAGLMLTGALYGLYIYTAPITNQFELNIGIGIERVAGRRN